ncbi:hypothetical protein HY995_00730 [Candidatus Micrarchaeota archaeon]|nr:hypothetical protein [Candidatus Micrarchaeota archaeon]
METKFRAYLIDVEPAFRNREAGVRLTLKAEDGKKTFAAFKAFKPYFYLIPESADLEAAREKVSKLSAIVRGREAKVSSVEIVERKVGREAVRLLKVFCSSPGHVPKLSEEARAFGKTHEYDIPFTRRFVIDEGLVPESLVEVEIGAEVGKDGKLRKTVKRTRQLPQSPTLPPFKMMSFDIETHNPSGIPNPSREPALMISYAVGSPAKDAKVITYSKAGDKLDFLTRVSGEREMLEKFAEIVRAERVDLLCGYNSDEFDLPYLKERAAVLKADFRIGRGNRGAGIQVKKLGARRRSRINGRIHFDAFNAASILNYVGAFKFNRLTLGSVFATLTGEEKLDTKKPDIWRAYDAGGKGLEHLFKYSAADAIACSRVCDFVLPLQAELAKVARMTLFDVNRSTPGQMVEGLLAAASSQRGEVMPNKPGYATVQARQDDAIQGAFVKVPSPGLYENIAVFDFKSLYPSIITSHNIDPATINCPCCHPDDAHLSPTGNWFCKKRRGIVPETLDKVLDERFEIKEKMRKMKKGTPEYRQLDARQFSLKILANSFYGYLVYARSRYYSREAGESTTALAREYIQKTMAQAEKDGFTVLYGDTDSIFLLHDGDKSRVLAFQKKINESLPGRMELELEDFYPRGIFVGKKHQKEEKGAKKKYALINESGAIKIRGFELVRRDWSGVARTTQRKVLEVLLKDGDMDKAVKLVGEMIAQLREGKVPLKDLAVTTQLRKSAGSYEVISPELAAVRRARAAGVKVGEHEVIEYIISRQGKTVSEKALLFPMAKEGDYDAEYYVNNQVLPAVLKILVALGVDEEDFKTKGKQKGLGEW